MLFFLISGVILILQGTWIVKKREYIYVRNNFFSFERIVMLGISAIIVGAGHILAGLIGIIFYVLPQPNHITIIGIFVLMVAVVVLSIGFGSVVKSRQKE